MQPTVQIDVDEASGIWRTDGLPMVYVPRHFMVNMHKEIEQTLGRDAYGAMLDRSGTKSAFHWCERQAERLGASEHDVFALYLQRLSERGWGRFAIQQLDLNQLVAQVTLQDSIYVLEAEGQADAPLCYMFQGFLVGAMKFVCSKRGITPQAIICREVQCAAIGASECRFEVACDLPG